MTLLIDGIQISSWNRAELERVHAGGLHGVHVTVAVWESARPTLDRLAEWNRLFLDHADLIVPALTGRDLVQAAESGRTGIVLGFQNTAPLEDDPRLVEVYHRLGVRIIQLTYNVQNLVGNSCYDESDTGLTPFGHEIVAEMNRLGVLVDCSHVGNRTTLDAIDVSRAPIAITHANPIRFCESPRNKPDAVIKALAARGGVLGLTLYPLFLGGSDVPLHRFAEMTLDMIDMIGIDHVAIGSDSTCGWEDEDLVTLRHGRMKLAPPPAQWPRWQEWFTGPDDFRRLRDSLIRYGLTDDQLDAVFGGNWRRLFTSTFDDAQDGSR
jgi:membrane dipeptidase